MVLGEQGKVDRYGKGGWGVVVLGEHESPLRLVHLNCHGTQKEEWLWLTGNKDSPGLLSV